MDKLKHKVDCHPSQRSHEIISPVTGVRCRNCGAERDSYKDMIALLKHLRMFVFDKTGYCATREEELAVLRKKFDKLGI